MGVLADLPSLAAAISSDLQAAGIAHAVSGAAAMAAHGYVRATRDLDLLVSAPSLRLPSVFGIVRRHGFHGEDAVLIRALRERYVAELTRGSVSVEILVPVLPYHRTLTDRAVRKRVAGVEVPFVALEDLVILKLLWRRTKDLADIQALLSLTGPGLDREYLTATLASILPTRDPRQAELQELLRRFAGVGLPAGPEPEPNG